MNLYRDQLNSIAPLKNLIGNLRTNKRTESCVEEILREIMKTQMLVLNWSVKCRSLADLSAGFLEELLGLLLASL